MLAIDYIKQKRMQKKWNWMLYVGPCQNFTDVFGKEANNYKNENSGINNVELLNLEVTSTDNTLSLSCTINLINFSKSFQNL